MQIRAEELADYEAIDRSVEAAFGSRQQVDLVEAIRASGAFLPELSLVAEEDGVVVGHVMISLATLMMGAEQVPIHNLSPLAVVPERQGSGIGSALVREVVRRAEELGAAAVILEGDPRYYGRFGFEPAYRYGIEMKLPSWAPPEAGQVLRLRSYDTSLRGRVVYPAPFAVVEH